MMRVQSEKSEDRERTAKTDARAFGTVETVEAMRGAGNVTCADVAGETGDECKSSVLD
jgi:hypothetical protein